MMQMNRNRNLPPNPQLLLQKRRSKVTPWLGWQSPQSVPSVTGDGGEGRGGRPRKKNSVEEERGKLKNQNKFTLNCLIK